MSFERTVSVEAYAKINLGLAVHSRRADGYHEIETVFQTVSLSDTLRIRPSGSGADALLTSGLDVPCDGRNLALKALAHLRARRAVPPVVIELTKRIPVAAGLGGGSSDAAAALVGVRALYDLDADDDTLAEAALETGSDVPYFMTGGAAVGRGRGEVLEPLGGSVAAFFALVALDQAISAAEAYRRVRIGLTDDTRFIRLICSAIRERDPEGLAHALRNDLEPGVVSLCPRVNAVKQALERSGALGTLMSGSGPTVFGVFQEEAQARAAVSNLRERGHTTYVVEPIDVGYSISTP
jgi:4-diphosphocytidyl-2-C-methyl-D-erythritol kinase